MSASRLILEIQRRARVRKANEQSDRFELIVTTTGGTFRGQMRNFSAGDNFLELGTEGASWLVALDQITSVQQLWL